MNDDNFNIIYKTDFFANLEETKRRISYLKRAINNNRPIVIGPGENVLIINNKNGDMAALGDIKLSKVKELRYFIDEDGNIKALEEGEKRT
ncbi:MAG: hypothetical protein J6R30_08585 [Bacteroidales bacterium]|nr:hypothetical protein [Bacteroidales bacterium]